MGWVAAITAIHNAKESYLDTHDTPGWVSLFSPAAAFHHSFGGGGTDPLPPQPGSRDVTVKTTVEPCKMIYGEIETSGSIVFMGAGGSNNSVLYFVIALAHHQCEAITEFRLDSTRIIPSEWASGTTNLVSNTAYIGEDGTSKLKIVAHLGSNAQTVDSDLNSSFTVWDSTHKGQGVAYYVVQCTYDKKAFPAGAPNNFFAKVKGRRLYDPRLDSTNGGSGSHRYTDATTWTYSNNAWLAVRDYITGGSICYDVATPNKKLTIGELDSRVDDAYIIAAANHCDESCTIPINVLAGTVRWSNAAVTVIGYGTNFDEVLAAGYKVMGPDGNFYTVDSVGLGANAFQITSAYAGADATSAVNKWFPTAVTSTTQARFTCDTQLSCGTSHADNLRILLSASLGHLSYVQGKYRGYAGVYDSPSVTLNEEDINGPMEVATHPVGEEVYNMVAGKFYDEDRNWQLNPFPSQTQSSYQTDDGDLYKKEVSFLATRTSYRCQRMANVLLNKSRNKTTVRFTQLSQKAILIGEWETFYVNISEYGWVNQVMRCIEWELLPNGFVAITAQFESSSAYADLAYTDYQFTHNLNPGDSKTLLPNAPTGLTVTSFPTYIKAVATVVTIPGQIVELWEHTSSTPFSSATKIDEGENLVFQIPKRDTTTRYYWVRTRLMGQVSSTYPASTGASGAADVNQDTDIAAGAVTPSPVSSAPADGTISYGASVQPVLESTGIGGTCSYTAPATSSAKVDVAWIAEANVDNACGGVAIGSTRINVRIYVNAVSVFVREAIIDGYITTSGVWGVLAGSTNVTVPAGQNVTAYLDVYRNFTTGGAAPAQTITWRNANLSMQPALR